MLSHCCCALLIGITIHTRLACQCMYVCMYVCLMSWGPTGGQQTEPKPDITATLAVTWVIGASLAIKPTLTYIGVHRSPFKQLKHRHRCAYLPLCWLVNVTVAAASYLWQRAGVYCKARVSSCQNKGSVEQLFLAGLPHYVTVTCINRKCDGAMHIALSSLSLLL